MKGQQHLNVVHAAPDDEFTISQNDLDVLEKDIKNFVIAFQKLPDDTPLGDSVTGADVQMQLQDALACALCGKVHGQKMPPENGKELKVLIQARLTDIGRALQLYGSTLSKVNLLRVERQVFYLRVKTIAYL